MGFKRRLTESFKNAPVLFLDERTKYILFSDCHRGTGRANDNYLKNEFLCVSALRHYYQHGFTYIELGDGDELWENRSMGKIKETHRQTFDILAQFYQAKRLHMIYGNHDIVKKNSSFQKKYCPTYYCDKSLGFSPLYPDLCYCSGIILQDVCKKDNDAQKDIYLTHGHQASVMNSTLWRVNRFLVRYLWKNLELAGVPDPTSAAKNNSVKKKTEQRLSKWAAEEGVILITGHTHRPMAGLENGCYFNTGSCVHPTGITGIEIENRCISLVKWSLGTRHDQTVFVERTVLGDVVCLDEV